ncbi:unnamed protein product, partial [Adineta steineri]
DIVQQSKTPSTPVVIEAPKVESKPTPPTPTKTTTTTTIRTKVVTQPEEEVDDNEGFQVVRYRKRISSTTGPEKISPPVSSTTTPKKRLSTDNDKRSMNIAGRQGVSTSTVSQIPKLKKDKKDVFSSNPPTPSSSFDTDIIPSSSIDSPRAKQIEQQPTLQQRKSVDVTQPKSLFSELLTSSPAPSVV